MTRLGLTKGLVGIDTNVLLRALLDDDAEQSPIAKDLLGSLTAQTPGFVTMVTLVEMYWVLTRKGGYDKDSTLTLVRGLVESDSLEFDDGEGVVRALALAYEGSDFADALIHVTMEIFGTTETVTFDRRASDRLGWRLLSA